MFVPLDAGLRIVSVGRDLHGGPRAVLVKPADLADELLADAISPEAQVIGLDRVNAELGLLACLQPFGPGVAEQTVGEQTKLVGLAQLSCDLQLNALGAEAGLLKGDLVLACGQLDVHRAGRSRASLERAGVALRIPEGRRARRRSVRR